MRCAIWYHLYNLKNVKNTHGGVLLLVKLQALSHSFRDTHREFWQYLEYQFQESTRAASELEKLKKSFYNFQGSLSV